MEANTGNEKLLRWSLRLLAVGSAAAMVCAEAATADSDPMPRDLWVSDIVAGFSVEETCHRFFLEKFKLTLEECAAKLEQARVDCPAVMAKGMPEWLDELQTYKLMGRSRVCLLTTIWGRPYNGEAADRASEEVWKKDRNGG